MVGPWAVLVAAVAIAGCSALVPSPEPECDSTQFDPPPALSCEVAVDAALDSLSSHPPVTAAAFVYGSICPPNARCMPRDGSAGTVIITFGDASQQSVYVRLEGGRLVVEAPAPYPPEPLTLL
jgi:hypothetical protein